MPSLTQCLANGCGTGPGVPNAPDLDADDPMFSTDFFGKTSAELVMLVVGCCLFVCLFVYLLVAVGCCWLFDCVLVGCLLVGELGHPPTFLDETP